MFACGSAEQDENGMPGPIEASIGETVPVCFYLKSPEDNVPVITSYSIHYTKLYESGVSPVPGS